MKREGHRVSAAGIVLAVSVALLASSASAASFPHPPHWLKRPYSRYLLSLNATDTAHAVEQQSTEPELIGSEQCNGRVAHWEGSGVSHATLSFNVLFGNERHGHKMLLAAVWKPVVRTGGLQMTRSVHYTYPPGCQSESRFEGSCTEAGALAPAGTDLNVPLVIEPYKRTGSGRFAAFLQALHFGEPTDTCTPTVGGITTLEWPSPDHFGLGQPHEASVPFTEAGIRAHRSFKGLVLSEQPSNAPWRDGDETNVREDPYLQTWSETTSSTASLTLSPAR